MGEARELNAEECDETKGADFGLTALLVITGIVVGKILWDNFRPRPYRTPGNSSGGPYVGNSSTNSGGTESLFKNKPAEAL